MPIRTRRHAGTLCVVVAQMVRRRRAFAGGVDADGGLKEKPPPLHETWGVMKLSSPQHAQNLLFLPIFDEQGRFFFHAACESTFSCSAGAVFLSFRSLDASYCEIGSASARTLRTLVKPASPLRARNALEMAESGEQRCCGFQRRRSSPAQRCCRYQSDGSARR